MSTVFGLMVGLVATGAARFTRRITATVFVIVTVLFNVGTPLAGGQTGNPEAQTGSPVLSPENPTVLESDGVVVVTLSMSQPRPAQVTYGTFDRRRSYTATAPSDYSKVSGDVFLAEGDTFTIKIPIVDDDLDESDETFGVWAWQEPTNGALRRGEATVRIVDDDGAVDTGAPAVGTGATSAADPGAAEGSSTVTPQGGQVSGSAGGASAPTSGVPAARAAATTTTTATAPAASPGEVALPSGERRPGPGLEFTSEGVPEPAPQRRSGAGASASGLAIASGIACLGVGALAVVRRRRRSSTTQA